MSARKLPPSELNTIISIGLIGNNGHKPQRKNSEVLLCCGLDLNGSPIYQTDLRVKTPEVKTALALFADTIAEHIFDYADGPNYQIINGVNVSTPIRLVKNEFFVPPEYLAHFQTRLSSLLRV